MTDTDPAPIEEAVTAPASTLWTAADVAAYLQISKSWVYQRSAEGELPTLRIRGLVRFDPDEIRAYARGRVSQRTAVVPLHRTR